MKNTFIKGAMVVSGNQVPLISHDFTGADLLGAVLVRCGINRHNYRVSPGLYAIGDPGPSSDVFVTANYKLSFDTLRKNLGSVSGWILVLDTKGINVWCAAGKGTFGTNELIKKIKDVGLDKIITHKRIILPQLGATGVAAHEVKKETGFNVHYGPVRASDIKKYINDGYRADKMMRKVSFILKDRAVLIPNDFIYSRYYLFGALAFIFIISGISRNGLSYRDFQNTNLPAMLNIFAAYLSGIVITPLALPYLPARQFSMKGLYSGALVFMLLALFNKTGNNIFEKISWFFIITSVSSFLAMNFTGSSTYTSLSGVKKEMKVSIPLQIAFAASGIILLVIGKLL